MLRLVGGRSENMGVVQVKHGGIWGHVSLSRDQEMPSDGAVEQNAANVVCKQLGYTNGGRFVRGVEDYFKHEPTVTWIRNLTCVGTETDIASCSSMTVVDLESVATQPPYTSDSGVVCFTSPGEILRCFT